MSKFYWISLVILALISLLPMKFKIRFYREPNEILMTLQVYLWFIPVSINSRNPMTRAIFNLSQNRFWKKDVSSDIKAKDIQFKRLYARLVLLKKTFMPVTRAANRFFHKLSRPVRIKDLHLTTELGLGDAAFTAVASGLVWSVKGMGLCILSYYFNIEKARPVLVVIPHFNNPNYLRIDYSCIFEFRLGHIIIVIYQLIKSSAEIRNLIRRVSQ